jgi:hypothetical protein
MFRGLLLAALLLSAVGCGAEPMTYAAPGDASYETAAVCTTSELAPFVRDATQRWHDAAPRVDLSVRVVPSPQKELAGCDVNVYIESRLRSVTGDEGIARAGLIMVDGSEEFMSDESDVIAHELGHLLIGGANDEAHSVDTDSVMFGREQAGEQGVTAADVAKIGKFTR